MTQKYCGICGNKINWWETKYFLKNGIICDNCVAKTQLSEKIKQSKKSDFLRTQTIEEFQNSLDSSSYQNENVADNLKNVEAPKTNIKEKKGFSVNNKITKKKLVSRKLNFSFDIFHVQELKSKISDLETKNKKLNQKVNEFKKDNDNLKRKNVDLGQKAELRLSIVQMKPIELNEKIKRKKEELEELDAKLNNQLNKTNQLSATINTLLAKIAELNNQIIDLSDELTYESYGLYKPHYNFSNSGTYKGKLSEVRASQKEMIRNNTAGIIFNPLTMDGSLSKGKSMQKKNIKQLIRSFNGECEAAINKVTKSNIETIEKKINASFTQLNKLNEPNGIRLNTDYLDSKLDESHIALEYALKKEEEKEQLQEQREREREERKLQREIASERAKYEKDEMHFTQAQDRISDKLHQTTDTTEVLALKRQLQELHEKLDEIRKRKEKLQDRAANPTAGYVYIISNIGSFGKDVYKIGVTRRLNPMDRINELGNASVPFKFDVNALVFSENAFNLESSLHNYFKDYRVNRVNKRKEYFKVPMDKIKEVLAKHKELTFDFNEYPDAYEYRDTLYIKEHEKIKL